ncbi:MAG: alpha/beta fold hydrolase [Gemmatimonadetes bacterium]|nr:alpha/beta fold hydrolase [Gemmatimonadota bacterium]
MQTTRQGSGPPLVLVHGLGARRESWRPLLAGLTPTREVVAMDLPGHGATPPLDGDLTFDRLVDALQQHLVDEGLNEADLVGSSMGARMVLELARQGVGRHVVALDPGGFWNAAEKAVFGASVQASFVLVNALRPALPVLAGTAAGRTALLPQFTPRPWAVPAPVALSDLQAIATTPELFSTLRALLDSGPQLGGPTPGRVVLGWGRRDRVTLPRQAARAAAAFLALPGVVAYAVPWLVRPRSVPLDARGLPLLAAGTAALLWCVRDFYMAGRGTLAPWAPPERLVVIGLYRFSRNPMYVSVLLILVGWVRSHRWDSGCTPVPLPSPSTCGCAWARNAGSRVPTARSGLCTQPRSRAGSVSLQCFAGSHASRRLARVSPW